MFTIIKYPSARVGGVGGGHLKGEVPHTRGRKEEGEAGERLAQVI